MSLANIRKRNPLIHCITNYVVANFTANGLLAIGASPLMADEEEEMKDVAAISDGLLINIGTVNQKTRKGMLAAGKYANEKGIPVLLDPVGVGASMFRYETVQQILKSVQMACIRCNVGELATIAGVKWTGKGVDAGEGELLIEEVAKEVAQKYSCIVVVTGPSDFITDGEICDWVPGGDARMTEVTGTGCLLSALCTAALTVSNEKYENMKTTLIDYKKVAENAGTVKYIGTFQTQVLDQLNLISSGNI